MWGGIDTVSPRTIALRMLDNGWLPWEISTKLDDIAERAKTMIVSIKMRRAAKWCRENL